MRLLRLPLLLILRVLEPWSRLEHGCHHVGVRLPGVVGGGPAGELGDAVVHVNATELLVCKIDNDILKHGDNLATYDHNDITGLLNPALATSFSFWSYTINKSSYLY